MLLSEEFLFFYALISLVSPAHCESEQRALEGEESGDSSKGSRHVRGIENMEKRWRRAHVKEETGHKTIFCQILFNSQ